MIPGNMNQMMKQVQKMQANMAKAQEEIAKKTVETTTGGAIKVIMTGDKRLVSLEIAREVIDPEDVEMLQDLVVAAINEAMKKAEEMSEAEMKRVMPGGMPKIPGMF
jgi:DNA-binding YbaB/EbfC family protein